jgi:hypothetical protein
MIRKGRGRWVGKGDALGQLQFIDGAVWAGDLTLVIGARGPAIAHSGLFATIPFIANFDVERNHQGKENLLLSLPWLRRQGALEDCCHERLAVCFSTTHGRVNCLTIRPPLAGQRRAEHKASLQTAITGEGTRPSELRISRSVPLCSAMEPRSVKFHNVFRVRHDSTPGSSHNSKTDAIIRPDGEARVSSEAGRVHWAGFFRSPSMCTALC